MFVNKKVDIFIDFFHFYILNYKIVSFIIMKKGDEENDN